MKNVCIQLLIIFSLVSAAAASAAASRTLDKGFLQFIYCIDDGPSIVNTVPIGICVHDSATDGYPKSIKYINVFLNATLPRPTIKYKVAEFFKNDCADSKFNANGVLIDAPMETSANITSFALADSCATTGVIVSYISTPVAALNSLKNISSGTGYLEQ